MNNLNYTYDPAKLIERGKDLMRFELGDVMVEGGSDTAALTDEEIDAALAAYPDKWKRAKLMLVESLCNRFSYEVDTRTDKLTLSLRQRAEAWKEMYKDLKAEVEAENVAYPDFRLENQGQRPYFHTGMMQNFSAGGTEQV